MLCVSGNNFTCKMILFAYLFLIFELISGQRTFSRGDRYGLSDYYRGDYKIPGGVDVLKDFSNSKILSHEPFIINIEFPKIEKSGDNRKSRFGAKRSRRQKKKNRRLRQFRQIVLPDGDLLERTKRFQFLQRHPGYSFRAPGLLVQDDSRRGKNLLSNIDSKTPLDKSHFGRFLKFDNEETAQKSTNDPQKNILQQIINPKLTDDTRYTEVTDNSVEEMVEDNSRKQWEDIKSKWISLFPKDKESNNEANEEEEKLKLKSHKMWANCQLLKLLKAPQRNPFFYKLLPPNYPALIMNEEKQLQCNKIYDIIDLSRDKKMIADKIEQLEKILSSEFKNDAKVPEIILSKAEETSNMRRKRDVETVEKSHEPENTLHDEALQGKPEGDGRSDRSSRTKKKHRIRDRIKKLNKSKSIRQKDEHNSNQNTHNEEHKPKHHGGSRNSRMAEPGQITTNSVSKINRLDEKELIIGPDDDSSEQRREKMEIKKESILQDVFKPSEVNKVIKQKELEANIFDKVVRTMKKYEENNPYDESFKPQKRENKNETEVIEPDSGESILEVDDAVKKLAKIFKILGVRAEAKKCENCDSSEEVALEEEDQRKPRKLKITKQSKKCTCDEDCPLCQDCLKCFRECKKNAAASKNIIWSRQSPEDSPYADEDPGLIAERKPESLNEEAKEDEIGVQEETAADRGNSVKVERTYRTKLPPSRDHVRLYFDNPQNKLLVWTKRGRRTMPWGPLTSDLQLYRDRARRILKSAEDILHRIKETEEKIHASEQSGENNEEGLQGKNKSSGEERKKEKIMDDIIKKVVNEDGAKSILRVPWEAELNKTQNNLKELEKETMELEKENGEYEEAENQVEDDKVAEPKSENHIKADERVESESVLPENELETVKEKDESAGMESQSVEAAVESVEGSGSFDKVSDGEVREMRTGAGKAEEQRKSEESEGEEYEDFPAKVESVRNRDAFPDEMKDEGPEKTEDRSGEEDGEEDVKLEKTYAEESKEVDYGTAESVASHSVEEINEEIVKASREQMSDEKGDEEFEDKEEKSIGYDNDLEEVEKSVSYDSKPEELEELDEEHSEKVKSTEGTAKSEQKNKEKLVDILKKKYGRGEGGENIFQDQIKPIENNYVIKGVKKTKEEKEAILKVLLHADVNKEEISTEEIADLTESPEMVEQTTTKTSEQKESDAFKIIVDHLSNGQMDEKDFEEVKNLDEAKIDHLVGEMQRKDEKQTNTLCDKHIKLCQIACGCNGANATTDIDKYDIIRGFLGWLKSVKTDQMVPISV